MRRFLAVLLLLAVVLPTSLYAGSTRQTGKDRVVLNGSVHPLTIPPNFSISAPDFVVENANLDTFQDVQTKTSAEEEEYILRTQVTVQDGVLVYTVTAL
jgi:hypothetical protein